MIVVFTGRVWVRGLSWSVHLFLPLSIGRESLNSGHQTSTWWHTAGTRTAELPSGWLQFFMYFIIYFILVVSFYEYSLWVPRDWMPECWMFWSFYWNHFLFSISWSSGADNMDSAYKILFFFFLLYLFLSQNIKMFLAKKVSAHFILLFSVWVPTKTDFSLCSWHRFFQKCHFCCCRLLTRKLWLFTESMNSPLRKMQYVEARKLTRWRKTV